jgi:hypothetical protein
MGKKTLTTKASGLNSRSMPASRGGERGFKNCFVFNSCVRVSCRYFEKLYRKICFMNRASSYENTSTSAKTHRRQLNGNARHFTRHCEPKAKQ